MADNKADNRIDGKADGRAGNAAGANAAGGKVDNAADGKANGKEQNPTRHVVGKVFAVVFALVVVLGVLTVLQTRDIARGVLEVCATQQDGYVQLVVDQINLKENREDEQIINDILETMDASSNKYWVFSRDQTMLFVKDVTETNRYKGFSATSYWATEDAKTFLDSLEEGDVKHEFIVLDGVEYLASGTVFVYDGRDYRLCLLTNQAALLDNNEFLGARSRLLVVMMVTLGLLVIVPMLLAFSVARERKRTAEEQQTIAQLSGKLHDVSERLVHPELYDSRTRVWSDDAFDQFVSKLLVRDAENAYAVQVICQDAEAAQDVLERASILLSEKVIRFSMTDEILALLFVSSSPDEIRETLEPLLSAKAQIGAIVPVKPLEGADAARQDADAAQPGADAARQDAQQAEGAGAEASRDAKQR